MYFEDITLGLTATIGDAVINKEKMLEFAKAYDNIPLHTDEEYAKRTPFGKLIAPGIFSYGTVWAKYLEVDFFGDELIAGKSTKIEWLKPVFPEDTLNGIASVTKMEERNERNGLVEVTIKAFNQNKDLVMVIIGEAVVKRRPEAEIKK